MAPAPPAPESIKGSWRPILVSPLRLLGFNSLKYQANKVLLHQCLYHFNVKIFLHLFVIKVSLPVK